MKRAKVAARRKWLRPFAYISVIAFILHYAWENAMCPLFYVHRAVPANQVGMLAATAGDVALTWAAYLVVALATRCWNWWLQRWRPRAIAALALCALVMSTAVEAWALATDRWQYTDLAPRLPGTPLSILPIAQLLLLFPTTFAIARRLQRAQATS